MIMSVSDNKRQSIVFLVRDQLIGLGKEPMSGSMHFSYQAFVTAFLQTKFFLVYLFSCEIKAVPVQWRSDVN